MENKIRNTLNQIYFGKTKDVVNGLRSSQPLGELKQRETLKNDLAQVLLSRPQANWAAPVLPPGGPAEKLRSRRRAASGFYPVGDGARFLLLWEGGAVARDVGRRRSGVRYFIICTVRGA